MATKREQEQYDRFLEALHRCESTLVRICCTFTDRRSDHVADLYQDIVTVLWQHWSSFRGESAVNTWITRVALNTACQQRRERRRGPHFVTLDERLCSLLAAKDAKMQAELQQADQEYINRHLIEWQRKYTLSVACLLLFLVGAPFGSIVRKGGLGLPLVASVLFFVLYYVVGMIAEKAVRESAIGPIGMWISTFALLPIGILLTIEATTDSKLFDATSWRNLFRRLFQRR